MQVKPPPSWEEKCADFAPLGAGIVEISKFELALDEFIWSVAEHRPDVAKLYRRRKNEKGPPHSQRQKLDFVAFCLQRIPSLRSVRMYSDGHVNFNSVLFMAEEVFELRNVLAHGAVRCTMKDENGVLWYSIVKYQHEKNTAGPHDFDVGVKYIYNTVENSEALKRLFLSFRRVIEEAWDPEEAFKEERQLRDNRKLFASLGLLPDGFSVDMDGATISFSVAQPSD